MKKLQKLEALLILSATVGIPIKRIFKILFIAVLTMLVSQSVILANDADDKLASNSVKTNEGVLPQQTISVSGKVTDPTGTVVPGVTIVIKGTSNGTITDFDGEYSLNNVPENAILQFSFVGMKMQEVAVNGQSVINVSMLVETIGLEEVVAVGYGSLSKKEISSSIVNVNKENFQKGAVSDPVELIVGKVAGLNIDGSSTSPHSTSSFQIRGATSITGGNSPLIVIDGIAGGNMNNVAPQDIESITVLKDGASAAIYGTRGANGVILITTKQSAKGIGRFEVSYDSYFAVNLMHDLPETLGYEEFLERDRGIDYGYHDDWLSELKRDFSYDNNQYLSLSGSTELSRYSVSLNYVEKTGLDIANAQKQYGARIALSQKALNKLVEFNTTFNVRGVDADTGSNGITRTVTMNPTMPIRNEDGTYYHPTTSTGATNAVENAKDVTDGDNRLYVVGTVGLKLNLINNDRQTLTTEANYTIDYNNRKHYYYLPSTHATSAWNGYAGQASIDHSRYWLEQFEWTVNYTLDAEDHLLRAVAGYSFAEDFSENSGMTNYDFPFDKFLYHDIGSGSYLSDGRADMYSGKESSRLVAVFGRINYSWRDLLTATASLRYEGSSRFGANNKWGYFPAVSGAWEIANMPFMADYKDVVSSLRLRASYGVTGRRAGGNYQSIQTYTSRNQYYMDGSWVIGYAPSKNANYDLQWELGVATDIGVDFDLLDLADGFLALSALLPDEPESSSASRDFT